jgi:anti-sigma regulatory factor (Ser/Thr protein kinase)
MLPLADDAELVVSELVTNALQAAWSASVVLPVLMRIRSEGERLVIEVWDAAPAAPELRSHTADAEGGRGSYSPGEGRV